MSLILKERQRIVAAQPYRIDDNYPAGLVPINSPMAQPFQELRINFNPVQEGSGDPSPSNVRNITGWTEIQYANLVDDICLKDQTTFETAGIQVTRDTNSYPYLITISGTASDNTVILIIRTPDNSIANQSYYVYNLPTLNGSYWVCGNGNKMSQVQSDTNARYDFSMNGNEIKGSGEGQMRLYLFAYKSQYYNFTFSPFLSTIAPITLNWSSSAGTLYGGYVDLVRGEVVATHQYMILNNPNNFFQTTSASIYTQYTASGRKTGYTNNLICSAFSTTNNANTPYIQWGSTSSTGLIIQVNDSSLALADVKSLASNNQLSICYELATPIHYPLTLTSPTLIRGVNNIWSTANGYTDVAYYTFPNFYGFK